MQRKTVLVKIRTQLSTAHPGFYCDRLGFSVQLDYFVLLLKRKELSISIGDVVEAVSRTQTLKWSFVFTNRWASSSEVAIYMRSVPYSRLPAQLVSLCSSAQANIRERIGLTAAAKADFMKVRLFTIGPPFLPSLLLRRDSIANSVTWWRMRCARVEV